MSVRARASLSNGKKSASVLELRPRRTDRPIDPERSADRDLLERLQAENLALRSWAVQLTLQIQTLRRTGRSEVRSAFRSHA
jgi:hypothetical protein